MLVTGLLGIVIALVGIYGVMAYIVMQRTREIGIRMALGALPSAIPRLVPGRAPSSVVTGLVIGLLGAWSLSGLVKAFLFETEATDPWIYAGVGLLLVLTGIAAAYLRPCRAVHVDPINSLRME